MEQPFHATEVNTSHHEALNRGKDKGSPKCCYTTVFINSSNWPLVGNEGMDPQYTHVKVDSPIPY